MRTIVSSRKRTNDSPFHFTGALRTSRFAQLTSRAARSPTRRARRSLERPTAKPDDDHDEDGERDHRDELERAVPPALGGDAGDAR